MLSICSYQEKNTVGTALLIAGCCIGAGMLGLPVVSATAGLVPSIFIMLVCCSFMILTGLLLLEAVLWFDQPVNLISLSDFALGKFGKALTSFLFLSIFYCLMVAYTSGCGELMADFCSMFSASSLSQATGSFICAALIGVLIYKGTKAVDHLNRLFMIGLGMSYGFLILLGASHIETDRLAYSQWKASVPIMPIMLISFGYHNLVPSLVGYTKRNVRTLRMAIIGGNLVTFLIYLVWQIVILGILPFDHQEQIQQALSQAEMVTGLLKTATNSPSVILFTHVFAFFAIVTSFVANALSCLDFLQDGLKIKETRVSRGLLCCLIILPPLFIAYSYPRLFLQALGYAGGIATVILFGILPAVIVWIGRYKKGFPSLVPGGKPLLCLVILLSLFFLGIEAHQQIQKFLTP